MCGTGVEQQIPGAVDWLHAVANNLDRHDAVGGQPRRAFNLRAIALLVDIEDWHLGAGPDAAGDRDCVLRSDYLTDVGIERIKDLFQSFN